MSPEEGKLVKDHVSSLARRAEVARTLATSLDGGKVSKSLRSVTKPPSMKRTLRTAGVALILTPDPVTTAAGTVMVGASFVMRSDPASLSTLAKETTQRLSDLRALKADLATLRTLF